MDCLLLINPSSGSGAGRRIASEFESKRYSGDVRCQVVFTESDRLKRQVSTLVPGRDLVIAGGGDGTVSNIVHHLAALDHPPPLAILPIGTGNDVARAVGWWNMVCYGGLEGFWYGVKAGKVSTIDVWSCGDAHSFLGYAGFGFDAGIIRSFDRARHRLQRLRCGTGMNRCLFVIIGIRQVLLSAFQTRRAFHSIEIIHDGGGREISLNGAVGLVIGNIGSYGGGGRLSPASDWSDGKLEVYTVPSIRSFIDLLLRGRLSWMTPPKEAAKASLIEIMRSGPLSLQIDGEWAGMYPEYVPLRIERMRALPVLVPPKDFLAREHMRRPRSVEPRTGRRTRVIPDPATMNGRNR